MRGIDVLNKNVISALVLVLLLVCADVFSVRVLADDSSMTQDSGCVAEDETKQETTIMIQTYGGDVYQVEGELEVRQNGGGEQQKIIEVQGTVEKTEVSEETQKHAEEFGSVDSTSITVYEGNKIYGFYSNYEVLKEETPDGNSITYYGFLVGYSENGSHSST